MASFTASSRGRRTTPRRSPPNTEDPLSMQARPLLLVMLLSIAVPVPAQDVAADSRLVDRNAGRPTLLAFDVPPGYIRQVKMDAKEGDEKDTKTLRISLEPPAEAEWTSGYWVPTAALCLVPATKSKQSYCANLNLDRERSLRSYGVARLFSESGEMMFRKLTSKPFEPHVSVDLRVVRKGQHVTTSFNGETIDEGDIAFVPAFWTIGASTGVAKIEVIEEVEVPLGPGEWPTTVEKAVALELGRLSSDSKAMLRAMSAAEVGNFWVGWGTELRGRLGMTRGNDALLEAACGKGCDPDEAAKVVMTAVWAALQDASKR